LDKITKTFPNYSLNGEIVKDKQNAYVSQSNTLCKLPPVPE